MNPGKHFDKSAAQYRWAVANIVAAALCLFPATYCFMNGYVLAGPLTLAVSLGAVWNADAHKKRGDGYVREAERDSAPETLGPEAVEAEIYDRP